ncbi:MAG: hypothetical protein Ct9H300mP12_01240 [Acidimicrobiales bacterium]|nr:MAG: hypothetical protein Ct9H300mP12_01240 [Acidimicrobiales bacterium]
MLLGPGTAMSAWWATATSRSTGSGVLTSATSSNSSGRSRTHNRRPWTRTPGSTQTILDAANAAHQKNLGRSQRSCGPTPAPATPSPGSGPTTRTTGPRWVGGQLRRMHDEGRSWADMAVFYRTNAQSRAIEEKLVNLGVPYKVVGGLRFYDRREVPRCHGLPEAGRQPGRRGSGQAGAERPPKRGVGDTSVARVDVHAAGTGNTFTEAFGTPKPPAFRVELRPGSGRSSNWATHSARLWATVRPLS